MTDHEYHSTPHSISSAILTLNSFLPKGHCTEVFFPCMLFLPLFLQNIPCSQYIYTNIHYTQGIRIPPLRGTEYVFFYRYFMLRLKRTIKMIKLAILSHLHREIQQTKWGFFQIQTFLRTFCSAFFSNDQDRCPLSRISVKIPGYFRTQGVRPPRPRGSASPPPPRPPLHLCNTQSSV